MSARITLTLRAPLDAALDLEGVTPDRCALLSEREIADLPVWYGGRRTALGEVFAVEGGRAPDLHISGDLARAFRVGAGMLAGQLTVDGDVGDDAGLGMGGGALIVRGDAGHRLGAAPPGAAKGMFGGEIVVHGSAGDEAAARCRRGLIVVGRDAGQHAGRAMIAGSLVVLGRVGPHPGRGNKRGSIVAAGPIDVPPTYQYACTYEPPHLRLTFTYLTRRYGFAIDPRVSNGRYRRYCGDAGDPGKGEILKLTADS